MLVITLNFDSVLSWNGTAELAFVAFGTVDFAGHFCGLFLGLVDEILVSL